MDSHYLQAEKVADAFLADAEALLESFRLEDAWERAKCAFDVYETYGNDVKAAKAATVAGSAKWKAGHNEQAAEWYEVSLHYCEKSADSRGISVAHNNLGNVALAMLRYAEAIEHYQVSVELKRRLVDTRGEATTMNNLGSTYLRVRDYDSAVECFRRALELSVDMGNDRLRAQVLHNIGTAYFENESYAFAVDYFRQSLELCREYGIHEGTAHCLFNLVATESSLGNHSVAEGYIRQVEEHKGQHDIPIPVHSLLSFANVYRALGRVAEAESYLSDAAAQAESDEDLAAVYVLKSMVSDGAGQVVEQASLGLVHARAAGAVHRQVELLQRRAEAYRLLGEFESSAADFAAVVSLWEWQKNKEKEDHTRMLMIRFGAESARVEAARAADERTRRILDSALDAVVSMNAGGFVTAWNPQAEKTFGFTAQEALGRRMSDLIIPPDLREAHERGLARYLSTGEYAVLNKRIEITAVNRDGEILPVELTILPLVHEGVVHFSAFLRDITDRKRAEALQRDYHQRLEREVQLRTEQLDHAHRESERLLRSIFPPAISERLKSGEELIAESFDEVAVLFADIAGFTEIAQRIDAEQLVRSLNDIFRRFDGLADTYGVEKIKTIGDSYMAVCGAPERRADAALRILFFAWGISKMAAAGLDIGGHVVTLRIGVHFGPVVAGVIGSRKFAYDLWGDAVNTASRMETLAPPNAVHLTTDLKRKAEELLALAGDGELRCDSRGHIAVKGKGELHTWILRHISAGTGMADPWVS